MHCLLVLLIPDEETACTVVDFIPFADLTAFPNFEELDWSKPDSFSDPINIPRGLLIGDQAVTTAYVCYGGYINFVCACVHACV